MKVLNGGFDWCGFGDFEIEIVGNGIDFGGVEWNVVVIDGGD